MPSTKPLVLTVDATVTPLGQRMKEAKAVIGDLAVSASAAVEEINSRFASVAAGNTDLVQQLTANQNRYLRSIEASARAQLTGMDQGGSAGALAAADALEKLAQEQMATADAAGRATVASEQEQLVLRSLASASALAANQFSQQAAAMRLQAGAYSAIEAEMGGVVVASDHVVQGHQRVGIAGMEMMHVVRSTGDSFAAGLPPMMIFTEQLGRVAEAATNAGGEGGLGKLGAFLGGPWGIAVLGGVTVLGALISHLDLFNDKLGDAVKKLKDQAAASEESRQAQQIFDGTLEGAIATQRKMNVELDHELQTRKQINAIKVASAQQNQIQLQGQVTSAQREVSAANANLHNAQAMAPSDEAGMAGQAFVEARAQARVQRALDALAAAQSASLDAETAVRKAHTIQLEQEAKDHATPKADAQTKLEDQRSTLRNRYNLGLINDGEFSAGISQIDKAEDDNKRAPRKARVDHTAEHEAEAEKKSDATYSQDYAATQAKLAEIARGNVVDIEQIAALDKQALQEARVRESLVTDETARRLQWSAADTAALQSKQAEVEAAKEHEIDIKLARDLDERDIDAQKNALDLQNQILAAQGQLATTLQEKLRIAQQIVANDESKAYLDVAKGVASGKLSPSDAFARTEGINADFDAKKQVVTQQNASPLQAYGLNLKKNTDDMNTALSGVAATGLKGLEDGLVGLIDGTENVSTAFKKMAESILADLARIAVEKLIVSTIGGFFGLSDGGLIPGKATGGMLAGYATGGLPGFAGGVRLANGMISGAGTGTSDSILAMVDGMRPIRVSNKEGIVNAAAVSRYWPMIDAMNKGTFPGFASGGVLGDLSGVSYPVLPSTASVHSPASAFSPYFDLRGAVMTQDLLQQMNQMSARYATATLAATPGIAQQEMSDNAMQRIPT